MQYSDVLLHKRITLVFKGEGVLEISMFVLGISRKCLANSNKLLGIITGAQGLEKLRLEEINRGRGGHGFWLRGPGPQISAGCCRADCNGRPKLTVGQNYRDFLKTRFQKTGVF